MPAVSQAQRRAAGMALAAKRGKGKAKGAAKSMMSMTEEQLKHYAETSEEGLPKKASYILGYQDGYTHH